MFRSTRRAAAVIPFVWDARLWPRRGPRRQRRAGVDGVPPALQRQGPDRLGHARGQVAVHGRGRRDRRPDQGERSRRTSSWRPTRPTAISCSRPRSRSATATRASSSAASASDDGVVSGPQADVADDQWGLLYEERGRGILAALPAREGQGPSQGRRLERVRDHRQGVST